MSLHASVYIDDDDEHLIESVPIGNAAMVRHLSDLIRTNSPDARVLLSKVLHSGSHCGDRLSKEDIATARRELDEVGAKLGHDESVAEFVSNFSRITTVALDHMRPVVF